jgi:membrane protein DedA with SNARE-associated domain
VDRTSLLWVLVLFFGTALIFGGLRRLTEDQSAGVTIAVQVAALAVVLGALVVWVRRRE